MKQSYVLLPPPLAKEPEKDRKLANSVLSCYQVLWHPELLVACDTLPGLCDWTNVPSDNDAPLTIPRGLFESADPLVKKDLSAHGQKLIVVQPGCPREISAARNLSQEEPELLDRFFSAGFALLGLQIVLRRMSMTHKLEEDLLWAEVLQAAESYRSKDYESSRHALSAALDVMAGNRQSAYPATINWVDFLLLPADHSHDALSKRLEFQVPANVIVNGRDISAFDEETLQLLREGTGNNRLEILGGPQTRRILATLPVESQAWEFEQTEKQVKDVLPHGIDCFASKDSGLGPEIPQILMKFGYRYAVHFTTDGTTYPMMRGPKLHWTASDGSVVETLSRVPINASDPSACFVLFESLAQSLANDRSPTVSLIHGAHQPAEWYQHLLRVQASANVFGKFERFSEYFLHSSMPEGPARTRVDEYHSQKIGLRGDNPIGESVAFHHRRRRFDAQCSLASLATILDAPLERDWGELEKLIETSSAGANEALAEAEDAVAQVLAERVLKGAAERPGILVVNPCSFSRRVNVVMDAPGFECPVAGPVRAWERVGTQSRAIVDVPGWGYVWFPRSLPTTNVEKLTPVAKGRRLKNTMIELEIDKKTGGVGSVWSLRDSYARLGQQIVCSTPSRMICRDLKISESGTLMGEIHTKGEIRDRQDKTLALYEQWTRLWRGRPVFDIRVRIEPKASLSGDPSRNYFALRWTWPDDKTAVLPVSGLNMQAHYGEDLEASDFLEFREQNITTNIVCAGLTYHRRVSPMEMDTLLIVPGESGREFHVSVGLDVAQPWNFARAQTWPVLVKPVEHGPPSPGNTGWLAKLVGEGVTVTSLAPRSDHARGLRLRLAETMGQACRAELSLAASPKEVRLANFRGHSIYDLHQEGETWPIDLSAHEWQQVEIDL